MSVRWSNLTVKFECESLSITEANRNSYQAVIAQWHDSKDSKDKQAKIGGGEQTYKLNIPKPKSDNEALKRAKPSQTNYNAAE